MRLLDCQPASPYRPVDWRWRRAEGIRQGLLPTPGRRFDHWVGRAIRFQDAYAEEGDPPCPRLARLDPAVFGALEVRSSVASRPRRELEARILARQTAREIAARLGLTCGVIEAYERLYFDVRDRLGAAGYIMAVVIGHTMLDGIAAGDIDTVLKVFAYGYGPSVLDAVIKEVEVGGVPSPVAAGKSRLARSIRMAIASRSIPVDGKAATGLVRINARFLEIEREAADDIALNGPVRAAFEPFPQAGLGGQEGPVTPAVHTFGVGATIGRNTKGDKSGDRAGITAVLPELDLIHPENPMRRTA